MSTTICAPLRALWVLHKRGIQHLKQTQSELQYALLAVVLVQLFQGVSLEIVDQHVY
jgi:hypothetical protein